MTLKTQLNNLKNNWLIVLLVIVVLGISLFGSNPVTSLTSKVGVMAEGMAVDIGYPGGISPPRYYEDDFAPEVEERILTKSASLSTEVKRGDFHDFEAKFKSIVSATDSILLNENVYKSGQKGLQHLSGNYQIKVESSKYDAVVLQLKEIGEILSFNENTQDITGSYVNLQDQLEVEKARLARFEQMFADAEDVSDKIQLNDRIFNQERTIKYLEDRLENMGNRVEYMTINFNLQEKASSYAGVVLVKFSDLVRNLVTGINSLLSLIFWALPYALVGFIAWVVYRKFKR